MRSVLTPLLFLAAATAAHAEAKCDDPDSQQTQADMSMCAQKDYKAADAKLNEAYKALMAKQAGEGRGKLKAAQRAWLTYRDAECDFETYGSRDGSIYPMLQAMCLEAVTSERTERLDKQANCEEGDLACGN